MRVVIKKKVDRDFMGGETTVTKIVIDEADSVDLTRLLAGEPKDTSPKLGALLASEEVEVSAAMQDAARAVFLAPERVAALRETLAEVYRAMEQARRGTC